MEDEVMDTELDNETDVTDAPGADESTESEETLTYDEDGNIVFPHEEDEESAEGDADGDSEEGTEADAEGEEAPEEDTEKAELTRKNEELEKKLAALDKSGKAALKKLGVKGDPADLLEALETLAAETEGKSLEDYRKEQRTAQETEEALALVRKTAYENLKKADLAEIHAAFPETAEYDDIEKIPNFKEYGDMRDKGISPTKAYAAVNHEAIRQSAAASGKKNNLAGTKAHLKSNVPKGTASDPVNVPTQTMREMKALGFTEKRIRELYKRTMS